MKRVDPDVHIPHGIKYSLTLHDCSNKRVLGYDNAHGIKPGNKKYGGKRLVWDHKHNKEKIQVYEFEGPGQLMEDFWKDVNLIIGK